MLLLWTHGYHYQFALTLVQATVSVVLSVLTWLITRQQRTEPVRKHRAPWLQVVVCVLSILVSGFLAAVANGAFSNWMRPVPHSSAWLEASGSPPFLHFVGNGLAQFVLYVLVTALMLLPFRIPPSELYLKLNLRESIPVGAVWIVPELVIMAYRFTQGATGLSELVPLLLRNVFQNGFSEEFLFRGAFLSRLAKVMSVTWALVVQALIFGFWHFGADMRGAQGNVFEAFAFMSTQMLFGFAMGFIAWRTRSLLVPSVVHVIYDALPL
jgi:membrane protease YdiL (CAAX protease family)